MSSPLMQRLSLYKQLMRLDKPVGIWLLFWPCAWGVLLAGQAYSLLPLFFAGAVLLRSAGCIINDLWDRNIDAQVTRTKDRPLASGAVSVAEALGLCALLALMGLGILTQFSLSTVYWGLAAVPLVILYPLMKRFTYWPQLFLGITYNWGILLASVAVYGSVTLAHWLLYAGAVFWTLGYDTIYACQDRMDDLKANVRSSALLLGDKVKQSVSGFYLIGLLFVVAACAVIGLNLAGFVLLGLSVGTFAKKYLEDWQPDSPSSSLRSFKANALWGGFVTLSLFIGTHHAVSELTRLH